MAPRGPLCGTLLGLALAVPAIAGAAPPAHAGAPGASGQAAAAGGVQGAPGKPFVDGEVIVRRRGDRRERRVRLRPGVRVEHAIRELATDPEVRWAIPNAIARIAGIPRDPGRAGVRGGWQQDQWNFLTPPDGPCDAAAPCGVDAIGAWRRLRAMGQPGGRARNGRRGPTVAVIDTGVAYRRWGKRFRKSPDLARSAFTEGRDLIAGNDRPLDRNGHGTHVASTIVERTGNRIGVTGLADGLRVMPIRALDARGEGTASDIARGIRWATRNGARVINLSVEFPREIVGCRQLRNVCGAIRRAHRRGVLVVAPTGNAGASRAQMPGRVAFGVSATTIRGCLSHSSSRGAGTDIAAPGGGSDDPLGGRHCDPNGVTPGIIQMTLRRAAAERGNYRRFGYPRWQGTSMAAAHVSAAAGLVLSSRILHRRLGRRPGPRELRAWLRCAARPIEEGSKSFMYGAGLLNVAAALRPRTRCPALAGL